MRITARLAYNQIRVNRSRSIWTWLAIVLSTALTITVCTFVASGNQMLVKFLGKDYGDYGSTYTRMLLIPACLFAILIVVMSVTVISNVFRISAQERISQFGVLKCTGATPKQIRETVCYEGIWMSLLGIPAGVLVGLLFAFLGIQVANHYIQNLNALAHIMVNKIEFDLQFVISLPAMLISILLSFLTVLYSAWKPASKAARVSAITCVRGMNEVNVEQKTIRENPLVKRIFGFEGVLADRNIKRNHKNFRATVISLSVGMMLFVSLGGLVAQAKAIQKVMESFMVNDVITDYSSNYDYSMNEKTGRYQKTFINPVTGEVGNKIKRELEAYENTEIFAIGNDNLTYFTMLDENEVVPELHKAYRSKEPDNKEYEVEIIVLDQENYEKLCDTAKVTVGSNILINQYWYNDFGRKVEFAPLSKDITEITLYDAAENSQNIKIQGVLTQEQIPNELIYPNENPVRIVMQNASVRGFSWYSNPDDQDGFINHANEVIKKEFPPKEDDTYEENGFYTSVYRAKEYIQVLNIAISLATIIMYAFAALLMLIGLTNVISTLSTNVMMRAREFAVLKSIGMTTEGMKQLLNFESVLCSLKAMIIGIPIGLLITIAVNLPIRTMYPVGYTFPWKSVVFSIVVVFILTWATTRIAVNRLKNQNIIEAIRSESGT